jgi:hypothetical protein
MAPRPDGRYEAQTPHICPKCGSHRTEIVGRSGDGRSLSIRCNTCGERTISVAETRVSGEEMTKEIEAMRMVGLALSGLADPASRSRVLRWASDRFDLVPQLAAAGEPIAATSDPMLAIGDLTEFFSPSSLPVEDDSIGDILTPVAELAAVAAVAQSEAPQLGSLVHNFASEFRCLADEWQSAFAASGPEAPAIV